MIPPPFFGFGSQSTPFVDHFEEPLKRTIRIVYRIYFKSHRAVKKPDSDIIYAESSFQDAVLVK